MSRVAKSPINIPDNVEFSMNENIVKVKGSKGELSFASFDLNNILIHAKFNIIRNINWTFCYS